MTDAPVSDRVSCVYRGRERGGWWSDRIQSREGGGERLVGKEWLNIARMVQELFQVGKAGDVKLKEAEAQGKSWFKRTGDKRKNQASLANWEPLACQVLKAP